jgi:hypothetical protein
VQPWEERGDPYRLARRVAEEAAAVGAGRLAVIAPAGRLTELAPTLATAVPELVSGQVAASTGPEPDAVAGTEPAAADLDRRAVLLSVVAAKGLEFDGVVVVDPEGIVAESPRGSNDLYVALTRATQRLGVFHLS